MAAPALTPPVPASRRPPQMSLAYSTTDPAGMFRSADVEFVVPATPSRSMNAMLKSLLIVVFEPLVIGAAFCAVVHPEAAVGQVICELPTSVIAPFSCVAKSGGLNGDWIAALVTVTVETTATTLTA